MDSTSSIVIAFPDLLAIKDIKIFKFYLIKTCIFISRRDSCEINIDDCFEDACLNGGECVDDINFFWCFCPENFGGDFCETLLDPETGLPDGCAFENCERRGVCSNLQDEPWFECECEPGVRGTRKV